MSDLEHATGYIAKILTSPGNSQWRGFVFQHDDNKAYSVTLNDKVPADLRAELAILTERDYVTFHYKESQGKDRDGNPKTYYNIYGLERPEMPQDEPAVSPAPTTPSPVLSERGKLDILRMAANNATVNSKKEDDEGDAEKWAIWFNSLRQSIETEYWKM